MKQKCVVAIHDISCFGKCSTTIVLPILSVANISTSMLPTALLSTHTGGLGTPYIRDGSEDMKNILHHWKELSLSFDAIYTGYVSSPAQIERILDAFAMYPTAFHYVDPVMGDHGKLYSSLPQDIVSDMKKLCRKADMITPNMTEVHILLDEVFLQGPYTKEYIETLIKKSSSLYSCDVILTGVYFDNTSIGCAIYEAKDDTVSYIMKNRIDAQFHGTGDVFASSFLGAYVQGCTYIQAAKIATTYTTSCISESSKYHVDERHGVNFESTLSAYAKSIQDALAE